MFGITVNSEKEDKRIPIAVASDVMFDIQLMLTHIGESFISDELGSYDRPADDLVERFTLYIDPNSGGISFKTTAGKGKSILMDRAVAKLGLTLEVMGSGAGTYWMEDNFKDPRYRCMVLYDLIQLSKHMSADRGYTLMFGQDGNVKRFMPIDIEKAEAFLNRNGRIAKGTVAGILNSVQTKRNAPMFGFVVGGDRAKISFRSKDVENEASKYSNGAVLVTGTLRYADDGGLAEVSDIVSVSPFTGKKIRHVISAQRDILLTEVIEASVEYDAKNMIWKLGYPDLGITSSDRSRDRAVAGFHDYFVFLCDTYLTNDREDMSDEETEVRDILRRLAGTQE